MPKYFNEILKHSHPITSVDNNMLNWTDVIVIAHPIICNVFCSDQLMMSVPNFVNCWTQTTILLVPLLFQRFVLLRVFLFFLGSFDGFLSAFVDGRILWQIENLVGYATPPNKRSVKDQIFSRTVALDKSHRSTTFSVNLLSPKKGHTLHFHFFQCQRNWLLSRQIFCNWLSSLMSLSDPFLTTGHSLSIFFSLVVMFESWLCDFFHFICACPWQEAFINNASLTNSDIIANPSNKQFRNFQKCLYIARSIVVVPLARCFQ